MHPSALVHAISSRWSSHAPPIPRSSLHCIPSHEQPSALVHAISSRWSSQPTACSRLNLCSGSAAATPATLLALTDAIAATSRLVSSQRMLLGASAIGLL